MRTRRRAARLLRSLWNSGGTLSQRAARGGVWAMASYGGVRILTVIRSIILARLLVPADFGLVSMAMVATGFLAIWTEIGMAPALIYRQDADEQMLNTAWSISVVRGVLLFGATYLAAGWIARFFESPTLVPIVRVMALSFVGYGLSSMGLILLKKDLDFRKIAYLELGSEVLSLLIGVVAAVLLRNAWALVWSMLSKVVLVLMGSYLVHPYRPRLQWRVPAAKALLGYGRYILGAGVVNYFLTQGPNAVVGRMLDAGSLGLYGMGYNLANMPATSIGTVIDQVAFPTYAKLQQDTDALIRAYLRVLKVTAVLAVPLMAGIMALAGELVQVLYGPNWTSMTVPLIILSVAGLERAVTSPVAPLFNAMGKPRTVLILLLAKASLLGITLFPLTSRYGIAGTSMAGALVSVILLAYSFPLVAKLLGCPVTWLLRAIAGSLSAAGVMVLALLLLKLTGWFASSALSLAILILVGAAVYAVVLYRVDRSAVDEVRLLISSQLKPADVPTAEAAESTSV